MKAMTMKSSLVFVGLIAAVWSSVVVVTAAAAQDSAASSALREINITSDSAPGWRPSAAQMQQVLAAIAGYLSALDKEQYQSAYSMMTEINRKSVPFAQFAQLSGEFHHRSGALQQRSILKVTWTKDPAAAPAPGVYAAVDIATRFANVDRHCGYVVLYQKSPDQDFEVMRQESNFIDNTTAQDIERQQSRAALDQTWARIAKNCPNYVSTPPPAPTP
jgi:Protein of unknown function (DUF4019)